MALSAVAVGCTKSEMIVAPDSLGAPIVISPYLGRTAETKATSVDLEYLQTEGYGFHVNAFLHEEGKALASTDSPYMNKDVYWVSEGSTTYFPSETATTKVVFSDAEEKPAAAAVTASTYAEFKCPTGWIDELPEASDAYKWYVVYTFTKDENAETGSWAAGAVSEIKRHTDGRWEYDGVTYWPDANSRNKLAFTAYGVKTYEKENDTFTWSEMQNTSLGTDNVTLSFTVADVVSQQNDLIVAPYQSGKSIDANASNTNVYLNFQHMLSCVGFKLQANQDNNSVEIKISRLELKGKFAKTGTVTLNAETPAIVATENTEYATSYFLLNTADSNNIGYFSALSSDDAQVIYVNNATLSQDNGVNVLTPATQTNEKNRYMMIMPSAASATDKFSIEVDYTLTDAETQTAVVELPETWRFAANTKYEFVLKVSTSAIGFYVEATDWITGEVQDSYTLTPEVSNN